MVVGELGGFLDGGTVVGWLVDSGTCSLTVVVAGGGRVVVIVEVVSGAVEDSDTSTVVGSVDTFSGGKVTCSRSFVGWVDCSPPPSSFEVSPPVTLVI